MPSPPDQATHPTPYHIPSATSSHTGTFYFAFGSNLSAHQMSLRLRHSPSSSIPVALARLDNYAWIICERGYANIVSLPSGATTSITDDNVVWGILYNMHPVDEARLDMYEGHNQSRNPNPVRNEDPTTQTVKPFEQGGWDYNKHYLEMSVTKWLRDPAEYGVDVPGWQANSENDASSGSDNTTIRALVYVDELRTTRGVISQEYIGRMNRGIKESVKLGLPQGWVDGVMRKFIPEGIHVSDVGYIGTDEGHVEPKVIEADGGGGAVVKKMIQEMESKGGGS